MEHRASSTLCMKLNGGCLGPLQRPRAARTVAFNAGHPACQPRTARQVRLLAQSPGQHPGQEGDGKPDFNVEQQGQGSEGGAAGAEGGTGGSSAGRSIEEIAEELLARDPEAQAQMRRVEAAADKVAKLQKMRAELEAAMSAAAEEEANQQEADRVQGLASDEKMADAEVRAAAKRVEAAELQLLAARIQRQKWAEEVDDAAERIESGKAAAVAAAAGVAASAPLALSGTSSALAAVLSCGTAAATCLLFGVTYRYALRQDVGNTQLKGGVVAAFGLARALGAADVIQNAAAEAGTSPFAADVVGKGMLFAGQSMLAVGFAAMAVEYAFSSGFVKPFGSASEEDNSKL